MTMRMARPTRLTTLMQANKELTTRPGFNTIKDQPGFICIGEMPERSKGAVLKTAERKFRGFESLSLRRCDCRER